MKIWRVLISLLALAVMTTACGGSPASLTELQRLQSGPVSLIVLSPHDAIRRGHDTFVVEFRSTSDNHLIDVGEVRGNATMPMPGSSPMFGSLEITRTGKGLYAAASHFEMVGTWRATIAWDGPAGRGSVTAPISVR